MIRKHLGTIIALVILLGSGTGLLLIDNKESESEAPDVSVSETIPDNDNEAVEGEPKLQTETLIEGLSRPWDIGFLPNGNMIVNQRGGVMAEYSAGGEFIDEITGLPDIYAVGEGGLLGLAIDPDFATNSYVYACYDTAEDIRISRWVLDGTQLTNQTNIVTGMPVNTTTFPGRHSGCRIQFDDDAVLWVGTGDVAQGSNPQDSRSLGGKILRVDRDGSPASGNLGGEFDARIYSYGHRNVQGLALTHTRESYIGYAVQHGPSRDDEINLLVPGNFGWDPGSPYVESVPMTDLTKFPDAIEAVWSSGSPTLAPSGATLVYGDEWGNYSGNLFVAMQKSQHLRMFMTNDDGSLGAETELFRGEFGRLRTVRQGPDGALYILTDNGDNDKIIRVYPEGS